MSAKRQAAMKPWEEVDPLAVGPPTWDEAVVERFMDGQPQLTPTEKLVMTSYVRRMGPMRRDTDLVARLRVLRRMIVDSGEAAHDDWDAIERRLGRAQDIGEDGRRRGTRAFLADGCVLVLVGVVLVLFALAVFAR